MISSECACTNPLFPANKLLSKLKYQAIKSEREARRSLISE